MNTWIEIDEDTGERSLIIPSGPRGHTKFLSLPVQEARPFSAITDWLNCSFPTPLRRESPLDLLEEILQILGSRFLPAIETGRGFLGWQTCFTLGETGARFAYGGQMGTAFFSLSGQACATVPDWDQTATTLAAIGGRITRWDGAVDDYLGEHTVDSALDLYKLRRFHVGGRPPRLTQYGNWIENDGNGRTVQIGRREHGKMIRVYEKGMELGAAHHPWVRWEVEIHNRGRKIPWDVLRQPGRYVVGAYPNALEWVQEDMSRIETVRRSHQISYDEAVQNVRNQYGKVIGVMMAKHRSADLVVNDLRVEGIPKCLKHALIEKPEEWLE